MASSQASIDLVYNTEWSAPSLVAQDGTDGGVGSDGLNSASVTLYQRTVTNSAPSLATTGSATYTFVTGAITGQPSGWSATIPSASSGGYLWVVRATAAATGATDTIANTEWSAPTLLTQDGATGADAPKVAMVYIYQRAASAPTLPSATTTYTFATNALTGLNNGWSSTIPAGTNPLYVAVATASGTGTTDTIGAAEWASPVS